jgi:hypothetical protein
MPFSGGGGGQLTAHVHDNTPLQGGPLNFNNTTIGGMNAGDITYSDGAALQTLAAPGVPAGEVLAFQALATAPSWQSATGATVTTQTVNPTHASTTTSASFVDLTGSVSITLPNRPGGFAILLYDWVGENSAQGYVNICWNINGVDLNTGAVSISSGITGLPTGCSISAITPLNGDVCKLRIRSNTGTVTTYSNGPVSGSTQGLSLEIS